MTARILTLFLAASLLPTLAGDTPEAVLRAFLDATIAQKPDLAYVHLSAKDQAEVTQENYAAAFQRMSEGIPGPLLEKISYKLDDVPAVDDAAERTEVVVTMIYPDFETIQPEVEAALRERTDLQNQTDVMNAMNEFLQNMEMPMTEEARTYVLVKEDQQWKVFENFAGNNQ